MKTTQLNGNGKIVKARTEIYVPYLNKMLAFSLPMQGPNNFNNVMTKIDKDGLRPTTGQTLSLVDVVLQNKDNEICKGILSKLFEKYYFWTATESLWGKKDVIVYDNVDGNMPSDRKSLIKRHKDGDKAVRIVPYGFQTGSQSVDKLLKNPYVIAQVGDKDLLDTVKRVAEGVSQNKPHVCALGSQNSDVKGYTALYFSGDNGWLVFGGDCGDDDLDGFASRVRNASTSQDAYDIRTGYFL